MVGVVQGDLGASATEVLSWGRGDEGQLGHGALESEAHPRTVSKFQGKGASAVACGTRHSVVIAGGAAYTCGAGDAGQLGLGDAKTQAYPRRVALGTCAARLLLAAGGGRHTLLVDARGAVHACGGGSSGQLGTGLAVDEHKPVALASLGGQLVRDAAAGDAHSVLLTLDGAVLTCGANAVAQLGHAEGDAGSAQQQVQPRASLPHVRLGS